MDRSKKIHMLDDLFAAHDELHAVMDALKVTIDPDPGCPLYSAIFAVEDFAISATAAAIGDKSNWLEWMIHENDCGRKGYEAGPSGDMRQIQSAEDLLCLIEEVNA